MMNKPVDASLYSMTEETMKMYIVKKDRKPIENIDEIVERAREHLRKHGLSI